jgi:hypothetical protein
MATKNRRAAKDPTMSLAGLQERMGRLQKDAEALLRRTQKQAASLISKDQRKALDRLLGQATRLRDDMEKRAERAAKDLEARAERVRLTLEKEVSKRIEPLLRRLDVPSRKDLQSLVRRVNQLERSSRGRTSKKPQEARAEERAGGEETTHHG